MIAGLRGAPLPVQPCRCRLVCPSMLRPLILLPLLMMTAGVGGRYSKRTRYPDFEEKFSKNVCESAPCKNGGVCVDLTSGGVKKFECACMAGYEGIMCQRKLNPCDAEPCLNGGQCIPREGGNFHCACTKGFQGKTCSLEKKPEDPCKRKPCGEHGVCAKMVDSPTPYKCDCHGGYTGKNCESEIKQQPHVAVEEDSSVRVLVILLLIIVITIVFIIVVTSIHCARVYTRRSNMLAAQECRRAMGDDAGEVPGCFELSGTMCADFCCCRSPSKSMGPVTGIIVPIEEFKSMMRKQSTTGTSAVNLDLKSRNFSLQNRQGNDPLHGQLKNSDVAAPNRGLAVTIPEGVHVEDQGTDKDVSQNSVNYIMSPSTQDNENMRQIDNNHDLAVNNNSVSNYDRRRPLGGMVVGNYPYDSGWGYNEYRGPRFGPIGHPYQFGPSVPNAVSEVFMEPPQVYPHQKSHRGRKSGKEAKKTKQRPKSRSRERESKLYQPPGSKMSRNKREQPKVTTSGVSKQVTRRRGGQSSEYTALRSKRNQKKGGKRSEKRKSYSSDEDDDDGITYYDDRNDDEDSDDDDEDDSNESDDCENGEEHGGGPDEEDEEGEEEDDDDDDEEEREEQKGYDPIADRTSYGLDDGYGSTGRISESDTGGRVRYPKNLQQKLVRNKNLINRIKTRWKKHKPKYQQQQQNKTELMQKGDRYESHNNGIYDQHAIIRHSSYPSRESMDGNNTTDEEEGGGTRGRIVDERYNAMREFITHPNNRRQEINNSTGAQRHSQHENNTSPKIVEKRKMKRGEILAASRNASNSRLPTRRVLQTTNPSISTTPHPKGILKKMAGSRNYVNNTSLPDVASRRIASYNDNSPRNMAANNDTHNEHDMDYTPYHNEPDRVIPALRSGAKIISRGYGPTRYQAYSHH